MLHSGVSSSSWGNFLTSSSSHPNTPNAVDNHTLVPNYSLHSTPTIQQHSSNPFHTYHQRTNSRAQEFQLNGGSIGGQNHSHSNTPVQFRNPKRRAEDEEEDEQQQAEAQDESNS